MNLYPLMLYPLITRDPASGEELIVTRLECPSSGVTVEGRFTLGWVGRLTPEQLDFVGLLLKNRNNLQRLATDLGVAYNTARSRLDDIVAAVGGSGEAEAGVEAAAEAGVEAAAEPGVEAEPEAASDPAKQYALDLLASGEIGFDQALEALKGIKPS